MAQLAQGQRLTLPITATQGYYFSTSGAAIVRVTPSNGGAFVVTIGTDETDVGWFGFDASLELISQSGVLTYNTTPSALTAVQLGDQRDSDAVDVALSVNDLRNNQAKQQQSVILFGDSYAESFSFPPAPYFGDQLSISMYRFVAGNLGNSIKVTLNAGVSGNTAAMMLDRYATDVSPYRSDWIFFNVGVNDFYGLGFTAAKVFSEVQELLRLMLSEGRKVLMVNCPPQVTTRSGFTATKSTQCAIYNRLIADYVKTISGVVLVDIYSELLDWNDTTNAGALPLYFGSDGIHLSVLGTIKCAEAINQRLLPFASYSLTQTSSPLDPGLGGTESVLAGTGGGNLAGSSGVVATGWASQRASGINGTIVASKIAPVGQRQVITLIATNGDSRFRLSCDTDAEFAAHLGKTVTTTIRGRCRTTSGGVHLKEFVMKLYLFDGATIVNSTNGNAYSGYSPLADNPFDTGEFVVTLRDIRIPSPLSDSGVFIELLLNSVAGGVVELDIYGVEIREVI